MKLPKIPIDYRSQINNKQHRDKIVKESYYCQQLRKKYSNAERLCEHFAACYIKGVEDKYYQVSHNDHLTFN